MNAQQRIAAILCFLVVVQMSAREGSLVDAARTGDLAQIRAQLKGGSADVNESAADGTTALHWAVKRDDAAMVDLLLASGADVRRLNRYGVPPIALAAINGHAGILTRLIKAGADPNTAVPGGETLIMTAARTGKPEAIRALLIAGAQVNGRNEAGQTALMWAAAANNAAAIRVLVEGGADLGIRTKLGLDAFMFAIRGGRIAATEALLDAGAGVNAALPSGENALGLAIYNAHWQLAGMLLDRGADPNRGPGFTALHRLVVVRGAEATENPALPTGELDSIGLVRKLLAKGVDINARMTKDGLKEGPSYAQDLLIRVGSTAFMLATKNTDVDLLKVLLAAGANPSIGALDGTTPLMVAAGLRSRRGDPEQLADTLATVQLCLELGSDVNAANDAGETALHGAAYQGFPEVTQLLLDKGARPDVKDKYGLTPLTITSGVYYGDKLRTAPATAAILRKAMESRGLSVEVKAPTEGEMCLYCFQSHPGTYTAQQKLAKELEAAFERQQADSRTPQRPQSSGDK